MSRRRLLSGLLFTLIVLLIGTLVIPQTPPVAASEPTPPPLPRGCGRGSADIDDYATAICCVSGYVYVNGKPVEHADVTLTLNGKSVTVQTRRDSNSAEPSYFARLDSRDWLNARPGDEITITARAYGQEKTQTFIAHEGGQQIDVVLPQMALDASWEEVEQLVPAFRDAAMAYDEEREHLLLFGGLVQQEGRDVLLAETWSWDGRTWRRLAPTSAPAARSGHVMAYDASRQRVVLFGGSDSEGTPLTDTWEWNGTGWSEQYPATVPAISGESAMVYDAARQRVLLVGSSAATPDKLATWAWDGTNWSELATAVAPPARTGFGLAYDTDRQRVVLFGGLRASALQNDTWEFTGTTWTRTYPLRTPSARSGHTMTYDQTRKQVILVGGVDGTSAPLEDSWAWNGAAWTELDVHLPPRAGALLAYDSTNGYVVLVGGYSDANARTYPHETWELDAIDWNQRAPRVLPPVGRVPAMAYDPARQRTLLFNGSTWEWDGTTWTRLYLETQPRANDGTMMVYDAARQRILLFGGYGGGGLSAETWEWDGKTWTQLHPTNAPPARRNHKMTYDAARQRVVLFGGRDETNRSVYDTWEWDGTTWIEHTPAVSPSGVVYGSYASMAYDSVHEYTLFINGNQTWLWDGTTWAERTSARRTSTFIYHSPMVYDPASQHMMFMDYRYDPEGADWQMWEWDGTDWMQRVADVMPPGKGYVAFAYHAAQQHFVLIQQDTYNGEPETWLWDGTTWHEIPDDSAAPGELTAAAMDYMQDGYSLLFGGRSPDGSLSSRTFRWQGNRWLLLQPATVPPARQAHRIARNADGSRLLLFGGLDAGGNYLRDTWQWDGTDWQAQSPASQPPARAYASLSYDARRDVWVLFGGQTSSNYLGDTWEYDGTTWTRRTVTTSPSARSGATLTYDAHRGVLVLIGGQNTSGLLSDVWEYDGTTWQPITPAHAPAARTGHGAAYDPSRTVVVVTGGLGATGTLGDTWEWNGTFWRERPASPSLTARYRMGVAYDTYRGELVVSGGETQSGELFDDVQIHRATGSLSEPVPIATINRLLPRDARQGSDTITFAGSGADSDSSDIIVAYRWSYLNDQGQPVVFGTVPTLTRPATDFPIGERTIRLEVQDNEGEWSRPIEETIYVRDASGRLSTRPTWTLLIYAAADNNLNPWMGTNPDINGMLYRLERAGPQERVQVAVLYDGPGTNDTRRYRLHDTGAWQEERLSEARMDETATLRDFVSWGYETFPTSDHYVLALVDHANGVVGFAQDLNSPAPDGRPFLTPLEIRSALEQATDNGARKLDVLHYDGCSFGLYETAAIADGLAHYVTASPTTAWGIFAYDQYRTEAGSATDPHAYAVAMAQVYARSVGRQQLAYTISVFDMAQFAHLDAAVSTFGDALLAYVNGDPANRTPLLRTIRTATQKYDSGGERQVELDTEDAYVDIVDLAERVRAQVNDSAVDTAASALIDTVQGNTSNGTAPFVLYDGHASHSYTAFDPQSSTYVTFEVNLDQAHGIGLFYPAGSSTDPNSAYVAYIQHRLFEVTRDNGWTRFLAQGLPPQSSGMAALSNDALMNPLLPNEENTLPDLDPDTEPDADTEPDTPSETAPEQVFLPLISR